MTQGKEGLSAAKVRATTRPGFYRDGGGLYLQVSRFNASKTWVFRYTVNGKRRGHGLGLVNMSLLQSMRRAPHEQGRYTLAEARREAERLKGLVRQGIDPIEAKHDSKLANEVAKRARDAKEKRRKTFKECAETIIRQKADELTNIKAAAQWESTLLGEVTKSLWGDGRKIDELTKHDIAAALLPIWNTTRETASRLRGRIEAVFNYAKGIEVLEGDNPAAWKGCLEPLLGKQKREATRHQPALPHKRIAAFMADLRGVKALPHALLSSRS
jgi:hypothetical protein